MITYDQSKDKTLGEVMALYSKDAVAKCYTMLPSLIVSYDAINQLATVQPLSKQWLYDETLNGGGSAVEMPEILEVPVCFPRAGTIVMTWPVAQGDECLVYFAHKSSFEAYVTGQIGELAHLTNGNVEDAVCIMQQFSLVKHQETVTPSSDSVQIRTVDGTAFIELKQNGTIITLKSPSIILDGNVSITGTTASTGAITSDGDITADNAGPGVTLLGHTHPDPQGGNTGIPNPGT